MDVTDAIRADAEPGSLHQRILADISDRIMSGEWAPGHRIPFEHELSAEYGCSRMTVNKALSQLAKAGLIERRRRSGSFVRRPQSQAAILEIHDIKTEVAALGLPYRYELTSRHKRKSTPEDRERLGLKNSGAVLELTCRHFAGAQPFCHENRLINLAAVPEATEEGFEDNAPGPWLIGRIPWSAATPDHRCRRGCGNRRRARHRRGSAVPGRGAAHLERRPSGDPCALHLRRRQPRSVARFTPSQS